MFGNLEFQTEKIPAIFNLQVIDTSYQVSIQLAFLKRSFDIDFQDSERF